MLTTRSSGVLLHPTSLPTRFGVGDLGPQAFAWIDWLATAKQSYWQVLPLVPTAAGESPYQSPSAFAGNPLLISPERLRDDGLLPAAALDEATIPGAEHRTHVDFDAVRPRKQQLLEMAARQFWALPDHHPLRRECDEFARKEAHWLDAHTMFLALREANHGRAWTEWTELVTAARTPLPNARDQRRDSINFHLFCQFAFWRQWSALRSAANGQGLRIIGDIPIYVSHDSADVWSHRQLFQLNDAGLSTNVAGVPPDYFSETGQLWSNPLYDWDANERENFAWWIARVQANLALVDLVRLDHFRGFEAYWSVPASETTAINGQWITGPGPKLFTALAQALAPGGELQSVPLIAEDLGMITEPVHQLRRQFGLPGMNVLQFQLPGSDYEPYRPETHEVNSVVYTGTHDNDTALGWFRTEIIPYPDRLERLRRSVPQRSESFSWDFLETAWQSPAAVAIATLQDILSLGSEARMNTPGTFGPDCTNWQWQYREGDLTVANAERLAHLTVSNHRA